MNTTFSVLNWCGWVQGEPGARFPAPIEVSSKPDVVAIPPLLRRRLNLLGRAAASQMIRLLADRPETPVVYCSRHGDIERTLSVLTELADGDPVSPMSFSLSVHNAVPGMVSIHHNITANISSIAGGDQPLVPGLLEALGMLSPRCPTVLCLFADVPLPAVYAASPDPFSTAYACGFLLGSSGGQRLSLYPVSHAAESSTREEFSDGTPVALAFARFLDGSEPVMSISHNGTPWSISKA